METKEKIEACDKIKNEGNVLFKDGKFQCASRKYEKECNSFSFLFFFCSVLHMSITICLSLKQFKERLMFFM